MKVDDEKARRLRAPLEDLRRLINSLEDQEASAVRAWLNGQTGVQPRALMGRHEVTSKEYLMPRPDDPDAIRSVGIVGGGTAGYLTALALRAKRPWLEVTLIESSTIPVIGVGEATVPSMIPFLHHYLGIDPAEFFQRVQPTWKLGIRFDWGPDPLGFMAPFDWDSNPVGVLGALDNTGSINGSTVQSLFMMADRTPVFQIDDRYVSLMKYLPFAYHLDNGRLVAYLTELGARRGVRHVDAKVASVEQDSRGWVDHLRTSDGEELRFDFYVDCSGFRSLLLEKAMDARFHSYAASLFTDSAVTGNLGHGGHLKPYTRATTMDSGWCWSIPTPESDHLGYVYSSAAVSDDDAAGELSRKFPGISEPRVVRFRSGRHDRAWRGNVMAIGNSYAFVEPLESSGLFMITVAVQALVESLPPSWAEPRMDDAVNVAMGRLWDSLRWFLAIHYRFNTRLDTPFWQDARRLTDVTGIQPLLDIYATGAPVQLRDSVVRTLGISASPPFYGIGGVDTILLGQRVPCRLLSRGEPDAQWHSRKVAAGALVKRALPQSEALTAYRSESRLLDELLHDYDSWAAPQARRQ
jgi:tryptophan halogenase